MASRRKLTAAEAAEVLGLSREQVYRRINRGDLPAINTANGYRIYEFALTDYIKNDMPLTSPGDPSWLRVIEVQEMLGCCKETVYHLCNRRILQFAPAGSLRPPPNRAQLRRAVPQGAEPELAVRSEHTSD